MKDAAYHDSVVTLKAWVEAEAAEVPEGEEKPDKGPKPDLLPKPKALSEVDADLPVHEE